MSTGGHYHLLFINCHLNFRFNVTSCVTFFILIVVFLPWSVSTGGVSFPCGDGGKFDSITCSHNNKLILTLGDQYYEGDCSDYPFYVYQEGRTIINRKTKIIATVVDTKDVIYFFERDKVIVYDNGRRYDHDVATVFNNFIGIVTHAAAIANPKVEGPKVAFLITLYNEKKDIFHYGEKSINAGGLPVWNQVDLWGTFYKYSPVNQTMPSISRIIGVTGDTVKTILSSSTENTENLTYYTALVDFCSTAAYKFNFFKCLEESEELKIQEINGQLIKCFTNHQSGLNLMTFMLWGSLVLIIFGTLGLLKCMIVWIIKKFRRSKKKVRFQEDGHKGDPKKYIIPAYGIANPHRIQTYGFDSMAQSAVSINDDYKDIDYSSDLEEEKITLQESESKPPLESIQSSNVI